LSFRRFVAPAREFSPFYAWDAFVGLDVTAFRRGVHEIDVDAIVQTVGTESLGRHVSVGATGYLLGVEYDRAFRTVALSTGFRHLSSHLTRDLDAKEEEVKRESGRLPIVADPPQYNIVYVKAAWTLTAFPLRPRMLVAIAPISFRLNGRVTNDARPVYLESAWPLWRGRATGLIFETRHEFGTHWLDLYSLKLDLLARNPASDGVLQIFLSVSPGDQFHVSPYIGGVVDGTAVGVQFRFRSRSG
jgi:hypothetical protein